MTDVSSRRLRVRRVIDVVPPHAYFLLSAVFHYLGPAFAVLLFPYVDVLGVAWLRIASAAAVFAVWRRPWRTYRSVDARQRRTLLLLGAVLGLMNVSFYVAISRLPLGTVGAIEFIGPIALAAYGARTPRNVAALVVASLGVYLLIDVRVASEPLGVLFAIANCVLFVLYIVLGHHVANVDGASGVDQLGAAMAIALVVVSPIGLVQASLAFFDAKLLLASIAVGICSSVIPYVCDQLAMARLARPTFALLLSLLPAAATVIGFVVLMQRPSPGEFAAIGLVVAGVAMHREAR